MSVNSCPPGVRIKQESASPVSDRDKHPPAKRSAEEMGGNCESSSDDNFVQPPSKMGRPGEVFRCKFCSYKAEKLNSLNRHMRIHNNERAKNASSPSHPPATGDSPGTSGDVMVSDVMAGNSSQCNALKSPSPDTFCHECRIQFSRSEFIHLHYFSSYFLVNIAGSYTCTTFPHTS